MRVLIVSDIRLYREALPLLLSRHDQVTVVGVADGHDQALECARQTDADAVLLDVRMPHALEAVRAITGAAPQVKVVALGVPEMEGEVLACAEAGVAAYVPRDASIDELVRALLSTTAGELWCSPRIAATLLRHVARLALAADSERDGVRLSRRELEVARLLDQNLSNKEIAQRLGIELSTAKNHVHNILEKLNVHRRSEAATVVRRRLAQGRARRDSAPTKA